MNTPRILIATTAALAAACLARAIDVTATEVALERAYLRATSAEFTAATAELDAALKADGKNPALLYQRGFASYAAGAALRAPQDKARLIATYEQAVATLGRVQGMPWEAEAAALEGSILGQLIGLKGGMAGMTLGPKSGQLLSRAARQLPASPRVQLFRAISLLNTPPSFGGNPQEGTRLLEEAVAGFAREDRAAPGPHWGAADALTWLGLAKQKAGDVAAARAAWEKALTLEPDYAWVKFALLPKLAQKAAP
jgi:tetratricopeptide (TPR) repeat protein